MLIFFLIPLSDIVLVFPGQPKPTTLDKKGVNRLNNLVPSTPASSKGGLKGKGVSVIQTCEVILCLPGPWFLFTCILKHGPFQ